MATVNIFLKISALVNGELKEFGSLYDPTSLTASANVVNEFELALSGSAVSTIFAASSAAVVLVCQSDVAGTYIWQGAGGEDDNSSIVAAAGQPVLIPGTTTEYANTVSGRAAASNAVISAVYFEHAGSGTMHVLAIR